MGFASSDAQQRSVNTTHPGKTCRARATEQVDEHRFRLVIGGMADEHIGWQCGVSGVASPRLQVCPWRDFN
jgi:hypothetical protein